MTRRGDPDRSTGPDVRFPAPVIAVLSSPNVVSDTLHLVRCLGLFSEGTDPPTPTPLPGVRELALLRQRIGFRGSALYSEQNYALLEVTPGPGRPPRRRRLFRRAP